MEIKYLKKLAIITPAKNEAENIERLVKSVASQIRIPDAWFFINDGSTDGTKEKFQSEIVKYQKLSKNCRIVVRDIDDKDGAYALGEKYSKVVNIGLRSVYKFEEEINDYFDFIGVLDCDVFPEECYYEILLKKFDSDLMLGIAAGGKQIEESPAGNIISHNSRSHAPGGLRVWRRDCLVETGYHVTISQDAVSEARAIMMGWKVRSFSKVSVCMRKRGAKFGYSYYGKSAYVRYVPFWYVLLGAGKLSFQSQRKNAIQYIKGYRKAKENRETRITDPLAKRYFRNKGFYKLLGR